MWGTVPLLTDIQQWHYSLNGGNIRSVLTTANHLAGTSGLVSATNISRILTQQTPLPVPKYCRPSGSQTRSTSTLLLARLALPLRLSHSLCVIGFSVTSRSNGAFCWGVFIWAKVYRVRTPLADYSNCAMCTAHMCVCVFRLTRLTGWLKD
jgi:hypothetical protein